MNVTLFPTSVGFCELETETEGSAFTVSSSVEEVAELPTPSLIMTYMELVPDELKEVVYVDDVAPETALSLRYHWYVYDPEPPDGDAVKVTELPASVGFCEEDMLTDGSEYTVSVREALAVCPSPSVTVTSIVYDPEELKE